jgi:acyl carrier protein
MEMEISNGKITAEDVRDLLIAKTGADPGIFKGSDGVSLEELGIDSLAVMELEAVIADKYGIQLPENAIQLTVSEIAAQASTEKV